MTNSTVSFSPARLPTMLFSEELSGWFSINAFLISSIPSLVTVLAMTGLEPHFFSMAKAVSVLLSRMSALFSTHITGVFFAVSTFCHRISSSILSFVQTIIAMSVRSVAFNDCFTLRFPSSPSSSNPAVSINTHGPMPCISIDLYTGSVVVPGMSETTETS